MRCVKQKVLMLIILMKVVSPVSAETDSKSQLIEYLGENCVSQLNNLPSREDLGAFNILSKENVGAYCSCTSELLRERFTNEMIENNEELVVQKIANEAGIICSKKIFEESFPDACSSMAVNLIDKRKKNNVDKVCACMLKSVIKVEPEKFNLVTRDTLQDYRYYSQRKKYPKQFGENSLLKDWKKCIK